MSDHSSTILIIVFVMMMSVLAGLEHMRAPEKSQHDVWREYARQLWFWGVLGSTALGWYVLVA